MERYQKILAIDPMASGIAYVVLSGIDRVIEWRTVARLEHVSARLEEVFAHFSPSFLAIESPMDVRRGESAGRVQAMALGIADRLSVPVLEVSRTQVRAHFGKVNKYRIAQLLAQDFPELQGSLPPERKLWMNEDSRINIFDALSLAIVARERMRHNNNLS